MKNFGIIKWFGGYNSKTDRENNFGFVVDASGIEAFLHKNAVSDRSSPSENDLLFLEIEPDRKRKDKWAVTKATPAEDASITLDDLYQAAKKILAKPQSAMAIRHEPVIPIPHILGPYESKLFSVTPCDLSDHVSNVGVRSVLEVLSHRLRSEADKNRLNEALLNAGIIKPFTDISLEDLSGAWLENNQQALVHYLDSLDDESCQAALQTDGHKFPLAVVVYLVAKGVIQSRDQLGFHSEAFKDYVHSLLDDNPPVHTGFLQAFIEGGLANKGGLEGVPLFREYMDGYLFKKYLFEKNPKFIMLFTESSYLQQHLDYFILHALFSFVHAGHSHEQVYNGFMEVFWRAIMTGRYDLADQQEQILRLFPSCNTVFHRNSTQTYADGSSSPLSCEAVFWEKQEMFLCRGTPCRSPKVLGSETSDCQQFSIYDWFRHYQIDYLSHKQPNKKDFPIKLAGYINRMREIFDVLHCRSCNSLMTPDLAYSRTQYLTYENGMPVVKDMAAAYRLTVFRCAQSDCEEYDQGHYINHCLNFYCHDLIDSRDSTTRCDNGRLICCHCATCCSEHDKSNPVGLCPDCGSALKLYRDPDRRNTYNDRFVACTAPSCGFLFEADNLPKKFTKLKGVEVTSARERDACCSHANHPPSFDEQPPFYCEEDLSRY